LHDKADALLKEKNRIQGQPERAARRPATQLTAEASGGRPGEPLQLFPRALLRTLLQLGVPKEVADRLIDDGAGHSKGNNNVRIHY